jgi:hypothetical protein
MLITSSIIHQTCILNFLKHRSGIKTSLHRHLNKTPQRCIHNKTSLQVAMSTYYIHHHQYIISKSSTVIIKVNIKDWPLIRALKFKTPKTVNEVASKLSSSNSPSKATSPARRLRIHRIR